jgi:hypothetical protein
MTDDMKIQGGWFDFKIKEGTKTVNLNDELQITVLEGKKGDRIGKASLEELNYETIEFHPVNNKFIRCSAVFGWIQGNLRVFTDVSDESITNADKRFYLEGKINKTLNIEGLSDVDEESPGEIFIDAVPMPEFNEDGSYFYSDELLENTDHFLGDLDFDKQNITKWKPHIVQYEWYTAPNYLEALSDGTVLVCILPKFEKSRWLDGWRQRIVDVQPNEQIETQKMGDPCYVFLSEASEIRNGDKVHTFAQYDCPKLVNDNYVIKNISSKKLRIYMIYKDV